jgi:uncharacterized membrane protein SirB2
MSMLLNGTSNVEWLIEKIKCVTITIKILPRLFFLYRKKKNFQKRNGSKTNLIVIKQNIYYSL